MISSAVIPGRGTDLGLARDRRIMLPKSAKADLGAARPQSIHRSRSYGFRARPFGPSRNDGRVEAQQMMQLLHMRVTSLTKVSIAV